MALFLFWCLTGLSAFYLVASLRVRENYLAFPVLFSGTFLFSIVPQMLNHVFHPGRLPTQVYADGGVEYALFMALLCLIAGMLGYQADRGGSTYPTPPAYNIEHVFWAGMAFCTVGLFGVFRLAELAGGFRAQFTEGGHYSLEWSGAPVIWVYVTALLPLGLAFCLTSALARGSFLKWTLTGVMLLYPLATILFLGRRSMIFRIALIVLTALWFQRRWAMPRWLVPASMLVGAALIVFVPYYRGQANQTGDLRAAATGIDFERATEAYLLGDRSEGMDNLIIGIPARHAHPSFGLGIAFWNETVEYLVPGSLLGKDLKESMKIDVAESDDRVFSKYCGQSVEYGSFMTGPYSVFEEFWFFGCLAFYVVGRIYRRLWLLANRPGSLGYQLVYASFALLIPMTVVNSVPGSLAKAVFLAGLQLPVLHLIARRNPAAAAVVPGLERPV